MVTLILGLMILSVFRLGNSSYYPLKPTENLYYQLQSLHHKNCWILCSFQLYNWYLIMKAHSSSKITLLSLEDFLIYSLKSLSSLTFFLSDLYNILTCFSTSAILIISWLTITRSSHCSDCQGPTIHCVPWIEALIPNVEVAEILTEIRKGEDVDKFIERVKER